MSTATEPTTERRLDIDGYAVVTVDDDGWMTIEHHTEDGDHHSTLALSPNQAKRLTAFLAERVAVGAQRS